jgi:hypothetical protein
LSRWNYRIFCDDAAWDALERLRQSDEAYGVLEEMLESLDLNSYESCQAALVAATTVDAIKRGIFNDILVENENGLDEFTLLIVVNEDLNVDALEISAIQALDSLMQKSALLAQWENDPEFGAWWDNIGRLRARF